MKTPLKYLHYLLEVKSEQYDQVVYRIVEFMLSATVIKAKDRQNKCFNFSISSFSLKHHAGNKRKNCV